MLDKNSLKKQISGLLGAFIVLIVLGTTIAAAGIGTNDDNVPLTDPQLLLGSLVPQVSETGKISLSMDGIGTNNVSGGNVQVLKPAGATVRKAYLAAATAGFSRRMLVAGDIKIDGIDVFPWDIEIPASITSYNYWKDVTILVKPKIDGAPAGTIDFLITEVNTSGIDGEILAVIFDDPSKTTSNTIVLLFGTQNIAGDTFNIGLANPINKADPNLVLDMSLGISFGYQPGSQYSQVDVNGNRMTTSAGGQDDGYAANGALLTIGGIGDSNANPANPLATDGCNIAPRCDDELYNLIPFVQNGDTNITVYTKNPSNDDNIFFSALEMGSVTAVVGQGIILSPPDATNPVGTQHTVTAKVQDDNGTPIVGRLVTFTVISGPNAGTTGTGTTGNDGKATFTYTSNGNTGDDIIEASFVDDSGKTVNSNRVKKTWNQVPPPPVPELPTIAFVGLGAFGLLMMVRRKQ